MTRWLKWMLGLLILAGFMWYIFIKEYHYQVTFTTKEPPGILYKHILDWDTYDESPQQFSVISTDPFAEIQQRVLSNDSSFTYRWRIGKTSDNKSQVTAYITDDKNDIMQKILVPFGSGDFVKRSIKNVELVGAALIKKAETYKVHSLQKGEIQPVFCAYIPLESQLDMKASTMMKNISVVMDYINLNEIKLDGDPFLEVTEWNLRADSIKFNFCFPIKRPDTLPSHPELLFKKTSAKKGITAEFNGNYRNSQNAWYYLLDYAKMNDLPVGLEPTEIFMNDPHEGGNPLEWKALIFLPLKE